MKTANDRTMQFMTAYADAITAGGSEELAIIEALDVALDGFVSEIKADAFAKIIEAWEVIEVNARFLMVENLFKDGAFREIGGE